MAEEVNYLLKEYPKQVTLHATEGDPRLAEARVRELKTVTNHLGAPSFADFDSLYERAQRAVADAPTNFAAFIEALSGTEEYDPELAQLKTNLLSADTQTQNEFVVAMSKTYTDLMMMVWTPIYDGMNVTGYKTRAFSSNRNKAEDTVMDSWFENQKMSPIAKRNESGEKSFDRNVIAQIVDQYKEDLNKHKKAGTLTGDEFAVIYQDFLANFGIVLSMGDIRAMQGDIGLSRTALGNGWKRSVDLGAKTFTGIITNTFLSDRIQGEGETALTIGNPLIGEESQGSLRKLAKWVAGRADVLMPNSTRNVEGKPMFGYQDHTHLSNFIRKLKTDPVLIQQLLTIPFSMRSQLATMLLEGETVSSKLDIQYADGSRKDKSDEGKRRGDMSEGEQAMFLLGLFHSGAGNLDANGVGWTKYVEATKGDKTVTPVLTMPYVPARGLITDGTIQSVDDVTINRAYNYVLGEYNRISHFQNLSAEERAGFGNKDFLAGSRTFFLTSYLNPDEVSKAVDRGIITEEEAATIWDNGWLAPAAKSEAAVKKLINQHILDATQRQVDSWSSTDIVKTDEKRGLTLLMDQQYLAGTGYPKKEDQLQFAALDYVTNYEAYYSEAYMLWSGDPALTTKTVGNDKGLAKAEQLAQLSPESVKATIVNLQKRLPKDIAPIITPAFTPGSTFRKATILDRDLPSKDKAQYDAILGKAAYDDTKSTDAQEYETVPERIRVLVAYGKIDSATAGVLTEKFQNNTPYTDKEIKSYFGPMKPVYVGSNVEYTGDNHDTPAMMNMVYTKSSSYPLLPQLTAGLAIDQLRRAMEDPTTGVDRVAHVSADKLGVRNPAAPYKGDRGMVSPTFAFKENQVHTMSRDGWGLQQELPEKGMGIVTVSQMNKLLFVDVREYGGFMHRGKEMSGPELEQRKEDIRKELFARGAQRIKDRLGMTLTESNGVDVLQITDFTKIHKIIVEEAKKNKWSMSDLDGIKVLEDGSGFTIPISLSPLSSRIEALLLSMVRKETVAQNIFGKSFVQLSSSNLDGEPSFPTTTSYDASKGLRFVRYKYRYDESYVEFEDLPLAVREQLNNPAAIAAYDKIVAPAQVMIPWMFKEDPNNKDSPLLDISKFLGPDGKIDHAKLPKELLEIIGARIPNQGHSSMLPIEIVGFVPLGTAAFVPDEITVQMGSDFDIDKLYSYMREYVFIGGMNSRLEPISNMVGEDGLVSEKIATIKATIEANIQEGKEVDSNKGRLREINRIIKQVERRDAQLVSEYVDLHWNVLTNPAVLPHVLEPLDIPDLKQESDLVQASNPAERLTSLIEPMRQIEDHLNQKAGKDLVGDWSLVSVFQSLIQKGNVRLSPRLEEDGLFDIVFNLGGQDIKMSRLSGFGTSTYGKETRSKIQNISAFQSAAVDNAKENILGWLNANRTTTGVQALLLTLESEDGQALGLDFPARISVQEGILAYVAEVERLRSPLSDDYASDAKGKAYETIRLEYRKNYNAMIGKDPMDPVKVSTPSFSAERLKTMLQEKGQNARNADYWLDQIKVLDLWMALDGIAEEVSSARKAIMFADRKGAGISFHETGDAVKSLMNIQLTSQVDGFTDLFGEVSSAGIENATEQGAAAESALLLAWQNFQQIFPYGSTGFVEATNLFEQQTGRRTSIQDKKDLYRGVQQFVFSHKQTGFFAEDATAERTRLLFGEVPMRGSLISSGISGNMSIKNIDAGVQTITYNNPSVTDDKSGMYEHKGKMYVVRLLGLRTLEQLGGREQFEQQVNGGVPMEFGTQSTTFVDENKQTVTVSSQGKHVMQKFIDGEGGQIPIYSIETVVDETQLPLAHRVRMARETWGENSYLLQRLIPDISTKVGVPSTVKYNKTAEGRTDEGKATQDFAIGLSSTDPRIRRLYEDLVRYAYAVGGVPSPTSFVSFIPAAYLEHIGIGANLRGFSFDSEGSSPFQINPSRFVEQYLQHNVSKTISISARDLPGIGGPTTTFDSAEKSKTSPAYVPGGKLARLIITDEGGDRFVDYFSVRTGKIQILYKQVGVSEDKVMFKRIDTLGSTKRIAEYNGSVDEAKSSMAENQAPVGNATAQSNEILALGAQAKKELQDVIGRGATVGRGAMKGALFSIKNPVLREIGKFMYESLPSWETDSKGNKIQFEIIDDPNNPGLGRYNPQLHRIQVNIAKTKGNPEESRITALHEVIHASTLHKIRQVALGGGTASERDAVQRLSALRNQAISALSYQTGRDVQADIALMQERYNKQEGVIRSPHDELVYGLMNMDEFTTHLLSEQNFQKWAAGVKVTGSKNIFSRFLDAITSLFKAMAESLGMRDLPNDSLLREGITYALKLSGKNPYMTVDTYQYFGKKYQIELDEEGQAIGASIEGVKVKDVSKILEQYMSAPDIDPQTGENWRALELDALQEAVNDPAFYSPSIFEGDVEDTSVYDLWHTLPGGRAMNDDQSRAFDKMARFLEGGDQNFVLMGRGGTGKTTILAKVVEYAKSQGLKTIGLTNAYVAKEILANGIPGIDTDVTATITNEKRKKSVLDGYDVIIVDETSNTDKDTLNAILDRMRQGAKVIWVGDTAQHLPINEAGVSKSFGITMDPRLVVRLSKTERQKGGSILAELSERLGDVADLTKADTLRTINKNERVAVYDAELDSGILYPRTEAESMVMALRDINDMFKTGDLFHTRLIVASNEKRRSLTYAVRKALFGDEGLSQTLLVGEVVNSFVNWSSTSDATTHALTNGKTYSVEDIGEIENYDLALIANDLSSGLNGASIELRMTSLKDAEGKIVSQVPVPTPAGMAVLREAFIWVKRVHGDKSRLLRDLSDVFPVKMNRRGDLDGIEPGYAITSNKAQGSTYRNVYAFEDDLLQTGTGMSPHKGMYVAASRPTTKLVVVSPLMNTESYNDETFEDPSQPDAAPVTTNQEVSIVDSMDGADFDTVFPSEVQSSTDAVAATTASTMTYDDAMMEADDIDNASFFGDGDPFRLGSSELGTDVPGFMRTLSEDNKEAFRRLREEGRIQTICK